MIRFKQPTKYVCIRSTSLFRHISNNIFPLPSIHIYVYYLSNSPPRPTKNIYTTLLQVCTFFPITFPVKKISLIHTTIHTYTYIYIYINIYTYSYNVQRTFIQVVICRHMQVYVYLYRYKNIHTISSHRPTHHKAIKTHPQQQLISH